MKSNRKFGWKAKAAALVGSLLAISLCLECGVRLFIGPEYLAPFSGGREQMRLAHRKSSVPGLAYELRPGARVQIQDHLLETDRYGHRIPEPRKPETPGLTRIICSGDSFTFGWCVPPRKAWPVVLQGILNRGKPEPFECINLGVAGYSTRDEVLKLEADAPIWNPKLVILGYVLNDPETDPIQPLQAAFSDTAWWQHSAVIREALSLQRDRAINSDGGYIQWIHRPDGERWKSVADSFDRLRDWAKDHECKVLVAIFPMIPTTTWDGYQYAGIHRQVADAAMARGFRVVDLLDTFRGQPPASERIGDRDGHPNELGHYLAAEAISNVARKMLN